MQAIGPHVIDASVRDRFFDRLGMNALANEEEHLVPFRDFLDDLGVDRDERAKIQDEQWTVAFHRPWTAAELPVILRQWISRNRKPLQRAIAATARPAVLRALVVQGTTVPDDRRPVAYKGDSAREAGPHCLTALAMLRLQQGKPHAAWQDLLACHRLARLVAQGPTLIDGLISMAVDQIACRGDAD